MRVQIGLFRFVSFDESIGAMTRSVLQVVWHGIPSFEVARALTQEIVATSRQVFTDALRRISTDKGATAD